ncbi:MAG: Holliday junction branch migration DNA helicase RuvB [Psittacicella sp.]
MIEKDNLSVDFTIEKEKLKSSKENKFTRKEKSSAKNVYKNITEVVNKSDKALRPKSFDEYIGQKELINKLKIYIKSALLRDEPLDHILFFGPPGVGKTSLAYLLSYELNKSIYTISAPALEKPKDLASILTTLNKGDILFIDEIHRISKVTEEMLYSAMEDCSLDVIIGEGYNSKTIKIDLEPFTLVGSTTKAGDLSEPFRDRFGIIESLNHYSEKELAEIINKNAKSLGLSMEKDASLEIAKRSRGTPRIANRILKRVRDFSVVENNSKVTLSLVSKSLDILNINELGLNSLDKNYLTKIYYDFNSGPVGIENICITLSESRVTIEDFIEPYLIKKGFIKRTQRGRVLTQKAKDFIIELVK